MNGTPLNETEQERAKVLNASGKTPNYIAKGMGRNRRTVQNYLAKPEVREVVSIQREELAGMFDSVAHRTLAGVTSEDIQKANLVQKMTSAGIAIDKAAMLRDQLPPTINLTVLMEAVVAIKAQHAAAQVQAQQAIRQRQVVLPPQAPAQPPPETEP
jgi:hypothetical protein